ncbi:divalent cation tolerance protein CutA [Actinopolymorpha pittospori]|uniref:divalent cation tolerance protein CutA n=1 Tax=Actinopolymorpha pittospori TaxID=648752 RepID=UPI00192D3928
MRLRSPQHPIRSIYRWASQAHDQSETRIALHTRADLVPAITERARQAHPYEVPCVIAVPIANENSVPDSQMLQDDAP